MDEFTADELIDETAVEEGTFSIDLKTAKGIRKVIIQRVTDFREWEEVNNKAQKLLQMTAKTAPSSEWNTFLPLSESRAELVSFLTSLVVSPKFSQMQALRFSRTNGVLASMMVGRIKTDLQQSMMIAETEKLDAAKNGSGPIGSDETTSQSAEMSSESTSEDLQKKTGKMQST